MQNLFPSSFSDNKGRGAFDGAKSSKKKINRKIYRKAYRNEDYEVCHMSQIRENIR